MKQGIPVRASVMSSNPMNIRGVKSGVIRGRYNRSDESAKKGIIESAEKQENWMAVATANGVKVETARRWIQDKDV